MPSQNTTTRTPCETHIKPARITFSSRHQSQSTRWTLVSPLSYYHRLLPPSSPSAMDTTATAFSLSTPPERPHDPKRRLRLLSWMRLIYNITICFHATTTDTFLGHLWLIKVVTAIKKVIVGVPRMCTRTLIYWILDTCIFKTTGWFSHTSLCRIFPTRSSSCRRGRRAQTRARWAEWILRGKRGGYGIRYRLIFWLFWDRTAPRTVLLRSNDYLR